MGLVPVPAACTRPCAASHLPPPPHGARQAVFQYLDDHYVAKGVIAHRPTVFPEVMPADEATREAWLDALTMAKHQGCGHMVRRRRRRAGRLGP